VGGIKSLSDKDLGAAVPCQTHFGEVWRGGEVESDTPNPGCAERSLADLAAAPAAAPAADAPVVELPPGWPSDVPPPLWWGEFTAALDTIWLLSARCCDCPQCGFGVAVEWAGVEYPAQWGCPRCGRAAEVVNQ
jgi:hypothetical protein